MGSYECACVESGVILDGPARLLLIAADATYSTKPRYEKTWHAVSLPIRDRYDGYGGVTSGSEKKPTRNVRAILGFGSKLTFSSPMKSVTGKKLKRDLAKMTLDDVFTEIRADGWDSTWEGRSISYALIDDAIYRGVIDEVRDNGAVAWRRYAEVGLGKREVPIPFRIKQKLPRARLGPEEKRLLTELLESPEDEGLRSVYVDLLLEKRDPRGNLLSLTSSGVDSATHDQLIAATFPWPEISTAIYGDLTSVEKKRLRPALVDLVRFLAWGTRLEPAYGLGRFYRFASRPDDHDHDAVEPYTSRARARYAKAPRLLAVVDANERIWRQREIDRA